MAVVELQHTLVVGLLDLCLGQRIALGVLGIEEAGDGVTEGGEGVRLSCLQACEGLLLPGLEGLLIGAWCGDREVEQLEHGLQILLGAGATDVVVEVGDVRRDGGDTAGQSLAEGRDVELPKPPEVGELVHELLVQRAGRHREDTATALCAHQDLVLLIVGLLQDDAYAIAQRPDGGAVLLVLQLLDDLALHRQLVEELLVADSFLEGLDLLADARLVGCEELSLGGDLDAVLLDAREHQHEVVLSQEFG